MYGTSPPVVEKDMLTYCLYYSAVVPFRYDTDKQAPIQATYAEIRAKIRKYIVNWGLSVAIYTVMLSCDYSPFPSPRKISEPLTTPIHFLHLGHLLNNYAVACKSLAVPYQVHDYWRIIVIESQLTWSDYVFVCARNIVRSDKPIAGGRNVGGQRRHLSFIWI